jgi:hypothetical protein
MSLDLTTQFELSASEQEQANQLERIWNEPKGFNGWFKAVHHTTIGIRYVVTAFCFCSSPVFSLGLCRCNWRFPNPTFFPQTSTTSSSPCMARR